MAHVHVLTQEVEERPREKPEIRRNARVQPVERSRGSG